jgi:CNT family concentrative nucleoside transporter
LLTVLQSAFGLIALLAIAWSASENRRAVPWRIVVSGFILQLLLTALLLKAPPVKHFFLALNDFLLALERATQAGTAFVFGYLGGAPLPFEESHTGSSFVLAFRALPLILVMSALSALLFYWRKKSWAWAERSVSPPRQMYSSEWWKRRCSFVPIFHA